jgi:hypothetical protein
MAHLPHLLDHVPFVTVPRAHLTSSIATRCVGNRGNSFHGMVRDWARLRAQEFQHQQGMKPTVHLAAFYTSMRAFVTPKGLIAVGVVVLHATNRFQKKNVCIEPRISDSVWFNHRAL